MSSYKGNKGNFGDNECYNYEELISKMMGFENCQEEEEDKEYNECEKPVKCCKEEKKIEKHCACKKAPICSKVEDFDNCCPAKKPEKGQIKSYKKCSDIEGKDYTVENKNYYNNYYTRYNHYYVKECNVCKDYVKDCNVYHYSSETVYDGCEYLGSTTVVKEDKCDEKDNGKKNWKEDKCKKNSKEEKKNSSCCCRK